MRILRPENTTSAYQNCCGVNGEVVLAFFRHHPLDSGLDQRHNQTVGRSSFRTKNWYRHSSMDELANQYSVSRQDGDLARGGRENRREAVGVSPVALEKLIHDLRQPLGAVDSIAYFLELTVTDEQASPHLERIRTMVTRASQILDHAAAAWSKTLLDQPVHDTQDLFCC